MLGINVLINAKIVCFFQYESLCCPVKNFLISPEIQRGVQPSQPFHVDAVNRLTAAQNPMNFNAPAPNQMQEQDEERLDIVKIPKDIQDQGFETEREDDAGV